MTDRTSTKNLGERKKHPLRLPLATSKMMEELSRSLGVPVNTVLTTASSFFAAQFFPLYLCQKGLSLDQVEKEMLAVFEEARRVVAVVGDPEQECQ